MFTANQIVETSEGIGRILYYDKLTHSARVILRTTNNTWIVKTFDETKLQPTETFIWTLQKAFNSKYFP